ncbi:hypothetical protein [Vampirovibrio sp.]|uniref:hypothetical protein n=1 Tax=Vampirovibrio sp. TaxID=2717857 RepID=UPI0035948A76
MFEPTLKSAYESGAEVIVQLKHYCCEQYKGRILELSDNTFNLFHSGPDGGMLWTFQLKDIAFCGLVVELPNLAEEASRTRKYKTEVSEGD